MSQTLSGPVGRFSVGLAILGRIEVRSWSYDGALDRLVNAAKDLRADAVIDITYHPVGFLKTMQAFAIKYE